MKNVLKILALTLILFTFSCKDSSEEDLYGNWIEIGDCEADPRSGAVAFTIGEKGYFGTGFDGDDRLTDFWQYDPTTDYWVQKADFEGVGRNFAVGFGIGTKGYIGTGFDGLDMLNDFWEYDPSTNAWTRKADFSGSARSSAVGFALKGKGYIGTGYDDSNCKDFFCYDPSSDTWSTILSIGGSKRRDAVAFVIDNKAYVGTGIDNGSYEDDFFVYDPDTKLWTKLNDISNSTDQEFDNEYTINRMGAVAFAINGKGYIATGGQGGPGNEVWEYDPITDLWEEKTGVEGNGETKPRIYASGFAIGDRGYVFCGRSSSEYFDDVFAFEPDAEYDEYD